MPSQGPHPAGRPWGASTYSTRTHRAQARAPQPLQERTHRPHRARSHWPHAAGPSAARTHEEQALDAAADASAKEKRHRSGRAGGSQRWGLCGPRAPPRTPRGLRGHTALSPQKHWVVLGLQGECSPSPLPGPPHSGQSVAKVSCPPETSEPWATSRVSAASQVHEGSWAHPDPGVGQDTVFLTSDTAEPGEQPGEQAAPQAASAPFQTDS